MIWKVKKGQDFRARAKHPWVFSNELTQSPKGITPGQVIELQTENGDFISMGYGNPHSLIAYRALSFKKEIINTDWLNSKIIESWQKRIDLGLKGSMRICFSENDELSGLIIDKFEVVQNGKKGLVLAVQISTAGMEKLISDKLDFFKKLHENSQALHNTPWSHTAIVLRNDVNQRKLENLEVEKPQVLKNIDFMEISDIQILIQNYQNELVPISTDLIQGQKTGFFLDQKWNIELLIQFLKRKWSIHKPTQIKVLDICSYVGHWSTQLSYFCKSENIKIEIVAADISEKALSFVEKNVKQFENSITCMKADVLTDLEKLDSESFDIVICDPPAFIKNKKDFHKGSHAYLKLNSQSLRVLKKDGLLVTCSCSGIFLRENLYEVLSKAGRRTNTQPKVILEGGHGPDHLHAPSFPEGFYLKMAICTLDS